MMMLKQTNKEYFASEGLSNSFMLRFEKSPAHAFTPFESTAEMEKGTLIHKFILEPETFDKEYHIAPEDMKADKRLKGFKELQAEYPDKEIMFYNHFSPKILSLTDLANIKANIYKHDFEGKKLGDIIANSQKEVSIFWEDAGVKCKGKIDILYKNIIFDIKKTPDCTQFQKSINNFKYYRQDAWYRYGIRNETGKAHRFIFIAVEDTAPFGVKLFELDAGYREAGDTKNFAIMNDYKNWNGDKTQLYKNEVTALFKPAWLE